MIFDIYDAGGATKATNSLQYPSAPVLATDRLAEVSTNKDGGFLSRSFDLRRRTASAKPLEQRRGNLGLLAAVDALTPPLAAGDKIGMIVVPAGTVLNQIVVDVENPVAGVTFTVAGRFTGQAIGLATNAGTAGKTRTVIAAPALQYNATANEVIEVTLATVPSGGLGELAFTISADIKSMKNSG